MERLRLSPFLSFFAEYCKAVFDMPSISRQSGTSDNELYGALHGPQGCLQYIDPVNSQVVTYPDTDRKQPRSLLCRKGCCAGCFCKFLGIINPGNDNAPAAAQRLPPLPARQAAPCRPHRCRQWSGTPVDKPDDSNSSISAGSSVAKRARFMAKPLRHIQKKPRRISGA